MFIRLCQRGRREFCPQPRINAGFIISAPEKKEDFNKDVQAEDCLLKIYCKEKKPQHTTTLS